MAGVFLADMGVFCNDFYIEGDRTPATNHWFVKPDHPSVQAKLANPPDQLT